MSLTTPTLDAGAGRIFEISPDGPLHFTGQDITANLPATRVMTLAFNRSEPDVLYAGTVGAGDLPRRTQRRRSVELVTFQQWDAARCDCHETLGERFWHYLRGNVGPWRVRASPTRVGF